MVATVKVEGEVIAKAAAPLTVTDAVCDAEPPAPVQVSVKLVVAARAAVLCDPAVGSLPAQPPEAVQVVAFVDVQVKVEVPPLATVLGLAVIDTVGAGAVTVIVADCAAEPPAPVHVSVNLVVAVRAAVACEPAVGSLPVQPPEAVQAVALVDDQVKAEVAPLFTVVGFAVKVTAGAGVVTDTVADWAALPPLPVQVSV